MLLTLTAIIRLVLRTKNIRTALGLVGVGGPPCKAIIAMLTESCAIYAVKLLVIRLWAGTRNPITNFFGSILLSEARICDLSRPSSSDALSNLARDWTVHHSTVHHPTSRQKERIDERYRRPPAHQFVQRYELSNPGFFSGRQTKRDSRSVIEQRGARNHDEAREHDPGPILSNNGTCKHLRRRR